MVHVSLDFGQGVLPLSIGIPVIGRLFATALLAETLQKCSAACEPFFTGYANSPYIISI
jgi:hypothetical protein